MSSCVPSVEPVSQITQWSMCGRTEARQRSMTLASSLTIMHRDTLGRLMPNSFTHGHGEGRQERYRQTRMRRTKIVATIGPACRDPETLLEMIRAGMDV